MRCSGGCSGGPVCKNSFLEILASSNINVDPKENEKIEKITDEDGMIEKEEFKEFAKRSAAVKEFLNKEKMQRIGHVDKAELVFKVINEVIYRCYSECTKTLDKDGSGAVDKNELRKLGGNLNKEKVDALMGKLDKDGDGKITLEEFRGLFKHIDGEN